MKEIEQLRRHVDALLESLPEAGVRRAILTGGTATQIGPLAGKPVQASDPLHLEPEDVERALNTLCSLSAKEIVRDYRVKPERAAVLPAGVAALSEVIHFYRIPEVLITHRGIREGVIEAAQRGCEVV